ncbi:uncharacterized protein LOC131860102 [Cryptomeria japonica]|uniref:uncharacterized protein LOC131860102 n=1 Tax=Cryptomeria japonica TaxID=3369 RepID=UPI0027DA71AC|nr:uncharacterized protein LOC131860102 [Cryptomeria japonica]
MIDESTDRSLEQHLVVYAIYLTLEGHGAPISMFMKMMSVSDGKGKTIYDTINQLMNDRGLSLTKLIAVSTDGASAMVGRENGFVSLMKQNIPNLISIHFIAHRESLAATDASKKIPELLFLEKIANKVHSWIQNSPKRNNELNELLRVMEIDVLNVLQIHTTKWLSRGEVIIRLVKLMPAILTLWKKDKKCSTLYEKTRIYSIQFCLHMLADVLGELNKLNKIFQEENVDITVIGLALDEAIGNLYRWFLRKGTFAEGTTYLSKFLIDSQFGCIEVKEDGVTDKHEFLYIPFPIEGFQSGDLGKQSMQPRIEGTKQSCQCLTEGYIQSLIDSLNERFPDLPLFNAAKLFSPSYYPLYHQTRDNVSKRWLDKLLQHLQHTTNNVSIFDVNGCKRELHSFVDSLHSSCEGFKMKDAWRVFRNTKYWHRSYPHMMKLWQAVLTIPASTVDCERGFSKQNIIKDVRKSKLALDTLDALMRVVLTEFKFDKSTLNVFWTEGEVNGSGYKHIGKANSITFWNAEPGEVNGSGYKHIGKANSITFWNAEPGLQGIQVMLREFSTESSEVNGSGYKHIGKANSITFWNAEPGLQGIQVMLREFSTESSEVNGSGYKHIGKANSITFWNAEPGLQGIQVMLREFSTESSEL